MQADTVHADACIMLQIDWQGDTRPCTRTVHLHARICAHSACPVAGQWAPMLLPVAQNGSHRTREGVPATSHRQLTGTLVVLLLLLLLCRPPVPGPAACITLTATRMNALAAGCCCRCTRPVPLPRLPWWCHLERHCTPLPLPVTLPIPLPLLELAACASQGARPALPCPCTCHDGHDQNTPSMSTAALALPAPSRAARSSLAVACQPSG